MYCRVNALQKDVQQRHPVAIIGKYHWHLQAGKALDLPVYFGDAGSSAVLHSLGAEHAACAVITLDTPGSSPCSHPFA